MLPSSSSSACSSSSSSIAISDEGVNLTALHEYREPVLVIIRKHLLRDSHSSEFFVFLSVVCYQLNDTWC